MRRVVIDTNLYIDWISAGRHESVVLQRDAIKYLSAVVILELFAGASSRRERRVLRDVLTAFDRVRRVLVPSGAVYEDAGHVLRTLRESRRYPASGLPTLVNDVLIALSARSIGATVLTSNARDFAAIRAVRPFKLGVVPV